MNTQSGQLPVAAPNNGAGDDIEVLLKDILAANKNDEENIKFLLVDDEPDIRDEMHEYLTMKGFKCESAAHAQQAIEKIGADSAIAVMLTDISMPGMDGLQLVKRLRETLPAERVLEIVILTGHGGRNEAIKALQSGVMGFLLKPVSLKELAHTAGRAMEAARTKFAEIRYLEALRIALRKEQQLNELQREFVSMVSHEFRTPLAIIDGAAQRIVRRKDKADPDELVGRVEKIRSAVVRMTELIDSTLYASRVDAGKIKYAPERIDFVGLVRGVCERQDEISPNHEIRVVCGELPTEINADPKLLDQVFTNLLSNAVKYSPESPNIDVTCDVDGDGIFVSVADHGVGIPAADMERMFERYFRASTSTGISGTGIGLNLVKKLVEMHGGKIGLESVEGEGTTFTVRLPVDETRKSQAPATKLPLSHPSGEINVEQQGAKACLGRIRRKTG